MYRAVLSPGTGGLGTPASPGAVFKLLVVAVCNRAAGNRGGGVPLHLNSICIPASHTKEYRGSPSQIPHRPPKIGRFFGRIPHQMLGRCWTFPVKKSMSYGRYLRAF